ncbi:2-oxoglutarate receptor 1-like [Falco cherrug]|uniref:2-oxoglutarate receptor 1-like n=1 Tax=Falco cherrug TaxID=345164 RepID=UPI0024793835|nr:2-oxoglutarate receptor 1-like [Falco cherrug]
MNTTNDNLANPTTWQDTEGDFPNCTGVEVDLKTLYLLITYSIISLVGFLGNIIVIYVSSFKMRPWKSGTIITLNLALTDLLYVTSLPFLVHCYASGEHWIFGEFVCKFIHFGFHFNLYSSILFLTCFSTLRYVVVVHPTKLFLWLLGPAHGLATNKRLADSLSSWWSSLCASSLSTPFRWLGLSYGSVQSAVTWKSKSTPPVSSLRHWLHSTHGNLLLYVVTGGNFQQAMLSRSRCKWSKYVQQPGSYNYVTKSETALKL